MVNLNLCTNSLLVVKQLQPHAKVLIVEGEQDKCLVYFLIQAKQDRALIQLILQSYKVCLFFLWHDLMVVEVTEKLGRSYFLEHYHKLKTICLSDFSAEE